MPTPRLQDGYPNPIFSSNVDRDDEPVEKYCNFVVEEVRANIKANAEGRGDREHRLRWFYYYFFVFYFSSLIKLS